MSEYFVLTEDKSATPATAIEWATQFEQIDRIVARTTLGLKTVSTVWLDLNHQFDESGPPLIFETMVFDANGEESACARCSTWAQAESQHAEVVKAVEDGTL